MSTNAAYLSPAANWLDDPALFAGVRSRRSVAFLIDLVVLAVLITVASVLVGILGVLTLGLGWLLYVVLVPAVALLYVAATLGGRGAATVGMRMMGLQVRRLDGGRPDAAMAVAHAVLFYASVSILTPAVLLVALVARGKRLLHDMAVGVVVVNTDALPRW